jgi:hypothetical protein
LIFDSLKKPNYPHLYIDICDRFKGYEPDGSIDRVNPFLEPHFHRLSYDHMNYRRLEHLASLGLKVCGNSVFEVGAGIGDLTGYFIDRGCKIVTSDARQENVDMIHSRYPEIRAFTLDVDNPPENFNENFEIVFCYGLLYHLGHPDKAIEFISKRCLNMLILETRVSPGDGELINPCSEDDSVPTESRWGTGCRPTRKWVFNQLRQYFKHVYLPKTQPWHEEFPIDWNSERTAKAVSRRCVYIATRQRLHNRMLTETIPMKQIRL